MKKICCAAVAAVFVMCFLCSCGSLDMWVEQLGERVIDKAQEIMDRRDEQKRLEQVQNAAESARDEKNVKQSIRREMSAGGEDGVDNVVMTLNYQGIAQEHIFRFGSNRLESACVMMECGDSDGLYAGREYFTSANESELIFENIAADGYTLSADYSEMGLKEYAGLSQDELEAALRDKYF